MPLYSTFFNLIELLANDAFGTNNNQFSTSNIAVIDALLQVGAVTHHHTGASPSGYTPALPALSVATSGGVLPASTTCYYEVTYANVLGLEGAPSPIANIATAAPVAAPATPTATPTTGTGTLPAGTYLYTVTAYLGTSTNETTVSGTASSILVATGKNVVGWVVPAGASGINVYRMGPGDSQSLFLTSVAAPTTTFTDTGAYAENCNRALPSSNTTGAQNAITITFVAPPAGFTANLYRTIVSGQWGSSQIASGLTGTTFVDTGASPVPVTPPVTSRIPASPSKVLLTAGAEVQGVLPGSMIASVPFAVTFSFAGALYVQNGTFVWVCPFTSATIVSVRASLGKGSTPASQPVKVDVLMGTATATPTWASIFASTTPQVPVGYEVGSPQVPVVTSMVQGNSLVANIIQAGGGATPTDSNLTITVYLLVSS